MAAFARWNVIASSVLHVVSPQGDWVPDDESLLELLSSVGNLLGGTEPSEARQHEFARGIILGRLDAKAMQREATRALRRGTGNEAPIAVLAIATKLELSLDAIGRSTGADVDLSQLAPQVRSVAELAIIARGTYLADSTDAGIAELLERLRAENNALLLGLMRMVRSGFENPALTDLEQLIPDVLPYLDFEIGDRLQRETESTFSGLIEWKTYIGTVQSREPHLLSDEVIELWRFMNKLVHFSSIGVLAPAVEALLFEEIRREGTSCLSAYLKVMADALSGLTMSMLQAVLLDGTSIALETGWMFLGRDKRATKVREIRDRIPIGKYMLRWHE